jgi:hypothetical protein
MYHCSQPALILHKMHFALEKCTKKEHWFCANMPPDSFLILYRFFILLLFPLESESES